MADITDDLPTSPVVHVQEQNNEAAAVADGRRRELKYLGFVEVAEGMVVRCVVRMYELAAAEWWRVYTLQKKLLEAASEQQHKILLFVDDKVEAVMGLVREAIRAAWPAALALLKRAPDVAADIQKLGIMETVRKWGPPGLLDHLLPSFLLLLPTHSNANHKNKDA